MIAQRTNDPVESARRILSAFTNPSLGRAQVEPLLAEIDQLRQTRDDLFEANNRYQQEGRDARAQRERALAFIEMLTADPLLTADDRLMTPEIIATHAAIELGSIRKGTESATTGPASHRWFMGEAVSPKSVGTSMHWVEADDAIDRLHCGTFLGMWETPDDPETLRIAFCTMGDEGDIFALGDDSVEGEDSNPSWRTACPDKILVPVDGYNTRFTAGTDETWQPTHRHKKRGSTYQQIGLASLRAAEPCEETAILVIYRAEDGKLWARPHDEFNDGRFEALPATTGGEA